jgi:Ca-activated chloride channel family protein
MRFTPSFCCALLFCPLAAVAAPPAALPELHKTPFSPAAAQPGVLLFESPGEESWLAPQLTSDVEIRVSGWIARAQVTQEFENVSDEVVSAVYVFPLPETAAVDGLTLSVGGRRVVAEIRERGAARARFEHAQAQGKQASLVEQQRPNLFTTRVANIRPHETIQVQLTYQQDVRYADGTFSLEFPATLTPRYLPGATADAPAALPGPPGGAPAAGDTQGITPPVALDGDGPLLHVRVLLDAGFPLQRVASPSHDVSVTTRVARTGAVEVRLEDGPVVADRDFRLEWQAVRSGVPATATFEEEFEGQRYALMLLLPPQAAPDPSSRIPRETSFIIDTSGSMSGSSIEQARSALESGLGALRPSDRFNVIAFDSAARQLFDGTVLATPKNLEGARDWVRQLEADGGTEMIPALELALAPPPRPEHVSQVVFVTDGSVGNEPDVFRFIQGQLTSQRLFTVGIGSAPNQYFMRGAARFGRGTFTNVASTTEVASRMGELWSKLDSPLLAQIELAWQGTGRVEAWPERVPDLYAGEPLVVVARLGAATSGLQVTGQRRGQAFASELPLGSVASPARVSHTVSRGIHRLWARRKIEGLMDAMIEGRSEAEVRPEVTALALQHQLLSRYTSLVAVDRTPGVAEPGPDVAVANELPAGNSMFGNMPQTATPGPTCLLVGALSLSAAWLSARRSRP